jgi:two-component system nitrogen regulation sensor histidine kinase NtrY
MTVDTPAISAISERGLPSRRSFEFARLVRAAGYVAVVLALTVATGTFFVLTGRTPIPPTQDVVITAMIVNGALVTFLIFVVAFEIGGLVVARRRGRAAARLHIRIVALFSIIAAAPAILVAVVASLTLNQGLDNWFSSRTRAIIDASATIAQTYRSDQLQSLHTDLLALKSEIERARPLLLDSPVRFAAFLTSIASSRRVLAVALVKGDGSILVSAKASDALKLPQVSASDLTDARNDPTRPVLIAPERGANYLAGLSILSGYDDLFLYVMRPIDPDVVDYLATSANSVAEYRALEATRFGVQLAFGILYLGITLVVLVSAIWLGISLANRLVAPIRRLIDAAKQVSQGNLEVRVPARGSDGDLGALGDTFNTMTSQLRGQRAELVTASEQNDRRRRFTEAVLSGATAGVIGVDPDERVTIANRSALRFLGIGEEAAINRPIRELLPQLGEVMDAARHDERPEHHDQIVIVRSGRERTVNVRVTSERAEGRARGYVVTLDDITDLIAAQRSSAWADVARRIAHEIKNPLTPIQLSAERLRRRFGKNIGEGREIFDQCTDTIIRQVGDIGRMVDEFSAFARMPKPAFEERNLSESIREAVFLIEVAHPDIVFLVKVPDEPLIGRFDARLMAQVLTNVVKNATEAIAAVPPEHRGQGRISVSAGADNNQIVVEVIDNGIGLPKENRRRLLEPYFTTREKGTGLGLAIVTKIVEDHGGRIELLDSPEVATGGRGALIRITLPRIETAQAATPEVAANA